MSDIKKKKNFNILYVDDERQNLVSFKATFRREYRIFTALNAKEGMEILRHNNIHLIISDQRMPGMTGVQFLEKILPEYPDSIRMVLTGFSDVTAIIDAINNGRVFRYITKPWDENELRMTIENARKIYSLQINNKQLVTKLRQKIEEQEKILKLFMKYVPEPIVQRALSATDDSIFEGELKKVAVLFCDIRNFTPMSEVMTPKEVVSFLNDYYSFMTACVKRHNGFVNQFVGDEVFAAFGTPITCEQNELNAVYCGLEMIQQLKKFNEKYKDQLGQEIVVGIGINYGEVVAGNLGSEERIDYSLTGDTVNTGKRIETVSKQYPNSILISENVYEKTKDIIETKAFDPIQVKGKKDKLKVYQVIGRKDS